MQVQSKLLGSAVVGAALALPLAASGATQQPAARVNAEGDVFTPGSLKFDPKSVSVKVGQIVRWKNTDAYVPHTATEDHGLWDLTGTYGVGSSMGFGPGESRQRVFEAGTQHYYCKVHPSQMHGVVAVPVKLTVSSIPNGHRIHIVWDAHRPGPGKAFDVQFKKGDGAWKPFRTATTDASGNLDRHGATAVIRVRARFRRKNDATLATGWSPVAKVTA